MSKNLIALLFAAVAVAVTAVPAIAQAQPKPDTEFCAKMRAKDPGGICTPKGDYVTPEKVYKPDGTVITRNTGD
jgi:hypothetical protein